MSDLTAIELILVILVGGQLSFFLSVARLKQWVDEIAIGVVGGVSVSLRHRSMMLWNTWMPLNFFVGTYALLLALGIAVLAQDITNASARLLGYLISGFSGLSFVGMIVLGGMQLVYLLSVLRESERQSGRA
jgi:hypothetical protein